VFAGALLPSSKYSVCQGVIAPPVCTANTAFAGWLSRAIADALSHR
jgi:hypothetical protein